MMRKQLKQKQRRGPAKSRGLIPHPPPLQDMGLKREVRLRFLTNAAFAGQITFENLLDCINVAATATTAYDLFYAVRVKEVEIWANALANASATVSLVFNGTTAGGLGDQKLHTDSSMGIEPAHVKARPAPMSLAAMYQIATASNAFDLVLPMGSIIDVSLSYRNPFLGNQVTVQNAPVAATAGVLYARGLDGQAAATSKFVPQGFQSID